MFIHLSENLGIFHLINQTTWALQSLHSIHGYMAMLYIHVAVAAFLEEEWASIF